MQVLSPESSLQEIAYMDEICDNAIDDDGDGLIDLNDPDCICETVSLASLIPNPSFEDYNCCPDGPSQLSCADGWDQASGATTDFAHSCGYLPTGIDMSPFPDGEGAMLFLDGSVDQGNGLEVYKEYAGACLNQPMTKDSTYRFKFHLGFLDEVSSPPINVCFFGSPDCSNLPFSQGVDCPTNYPDWYLLENAVVSSGGETNAWVEVSIEIKPTIDINALVIGGPCYYEPLNGLSVYYLDNLRLSDKSNFDFELLDQGSPCDSNYVFAVTEDPISEYQWYKEGVALVGETNAALSQMYGEGFYQLRITDTNTLDCRVADDFEFSIPVIEEDAFETICQGGSLDYHGNTIDEPGIYNFTLTSAAGCDSIVTLYVDTEAQLTDTVRARIFEGASYMIGNAQFVDEGKHEVNLSSALGCDSLVILFLEYIHVYIPDAFSPNGDLVNDIFEVYISDEELTMYEMSIFDRWGNLLHTGTNWNGKVNGTDVDQGVYVYLVTLTDTAGEQHVYKSSVSLFR